MNTKINPHFLFKYIMFSLVALGILFFVPWFSSDVDNTVLDSTNIISGVQVSRYSDMLGELAGKSLGSLVSLGLSIIQYSYILPALAVLAALVLPIHKKTGSVLAAIASLSHILVTILFVFLPKSMAEFISLMFVVTPTIFLYGIIGAGCLILSTMLFLHEKRNMHRDDDMKIVKKRGRTATTETEEKKAPSKKPSKKKINVSRKR